MSLRVVNIVSTCNLNTDLNLKVLAINMTNVTYRPNTFIAIIKKYYNPRSTILIFPNGKLVISGSPTVEIAKENALKLSTELNMPEATDFKVQNVVATVDLRTVIKRKDKPTIINLTELQVRLNFKCNYNQELFAGLIFKLSGTTVLIFHNGKVIFTGTKSDEQIMLTYINLIEMLVDFEMIELNV
jgi:transcription initiation factor TFIID TATA-box-binding protein